MQEISGEEEMHKSLPEEKETFVGFFSQGKRDLSFCLYIRAEGKEPVRC